MACLMKGRFNRDTGQAAFRGKGVRSGGGNACGRNRRGKSNNPRERKKRTKRGGGGGGSSWENEDGPQVWGCSERGDHLGKETGGKEKSM